MHERGPFRAGQQKSSKWPSYLTDKGTVHGTVERTVYILCTDPTTVLCTVAHAHQPGARDRHVRHRTVNHRVESTYYRHSIGENKQRPDPTRVDPITPRSPAPTRHSAVHTLSTLVSRIARAWLIRLISTHQVSNARKPVQRPALLGARSVVRQLVGHRI